MFAKRFQQILYPHKLWNREELLGFSSPLPGKPGIYAWYFSSFPPEIPVHDVYSYQGLPLLYVGIAPSRPGSSSNLRKRIKQHLKSNAYGSTLRLTLGCLLGLELRRVSTTRMTFAKSGEQQLSEWLSKNAFVAWQQADDPWYLEEQILAEISLPLNLRGNESHPFYPTLRELRQQAKQRAQGLPIVNTRVLS
jgi:hypothetical protein